VVRLTVETDVAQFYYSLRSLDAQLQILADNVAAYREQVRILSVQLKAGLISAIAASPRERHAGQEQRGSSRRSKRSRMRAVDVRRRAAATADLRIFGGVRNGWSRSAVETKGRGTRKRKQA